MSVPRRLRMIHFHVRSPLNRPGLREQKMKKLAASILASDFGRLSEEVKAVELAGADWIHVDVMDGHFVPNITIGPGVLRAVRKATSLPLDVHLMIEKPENYIDEFADGGADWLSVHAEATFRLHRIVEKIKALGVKASVALNPASPLGHLECILADLDMILVMTVNPGFGGQKLITSMLSKVQECRRRSAGGGKRPPGGGWRGAHRLDRQNGRGRSGCFCSRVGNL